MIERYDDRTIRCPQLGHEVKFTYCRIMNNRLPCRRIAGCWAGELDIREFLTANYSREELDRVCATPPPKMESLVELIEKVKKRKTRG
jgi:hypothetical protein